MANQNAKFIDVTKTFVPLDPKVFPQSMHGTQGEDSPEQKIPVMAYEGKNILPTAQGYSSYFGISRTLDIDALPARCDKIFILQNEFYRNILIALTESGIYVKQGNTVGAWTQVVVMSPAADDSAHYDWTTTVINQKLYAYRQGHPSYQLIVGDLALGVAITSIVPSFLNMTGQVGIFRAGGRLGFWDSDSSVAWSNLDDFSDFLPSILTLANSVKFSDINGRIVTIVSHGAGFVIYCTKSIVFVRPNEEATFQWDPIVVFSTNGITYPRQVDLGSPDTTHFAATTIGLYKIENGRPELIVPEVTDMLEKMNAPIYLKVMEGRYLFLEVLDPDYLDSLVQFSKNTVDQSPFVFPAPGNTLADAVDDELLQGTNMCLTLDKVDDGTFADTPAEPFDKKPGTTWKPKWTAYLSKKGQWGPVTDWNATPAATVDPNGIEKNQCPVQGEGNKLSANNTTSSGKTVVTGDQMYIDGIWTMERFVAVQQAIWDAEEASIDSFINSVIARSSYGEKISYSGLPYADTPEVINKQLIGDYARRYTKGYFGFSKCEFWLTRYCYQATKIYRIKRNTVTTSDTETTLGLLHYTTDNGGSYGSVAAAAASLFPGGYTVEDHMGNYGPNFLIQDGGRRTLLSHSVARGEPYVAPFISIIFAVYQVSAPLTTGSYLVVPTKNSRTVSWHSSGRYKKSEQMFANNREETYDVNPFVPDTGYCTLTGWDYTTNADGTNSIAAAACGGPAEFPKGSTPRLAVASVGAKLGNDGSFCSKPFEPVTVPGSPPLVLTWPEQTVTVPGGVFLLQDGSIAPVYPTMYGALVYDLFLKKWGKMNQSYKLLLDYSPVNSADSGGVPYANFGILGGILAGDYKLKLFDNVPVESYITYGKIGYYRMGYTAGQEVRAQFAIESTGFITVDASYDGKQTESSLTKIASFTNSLTGALTGINPGRWHNITISGQFEINYLEYRGFQQGRR